jgi:hypothetical protein
LRSHVLSAAQIQRRLILLKAVQPLAGDNVVIVIRTWF